MTPEQLEVAIAETQQLVLLYQQAADDALCMVQRGAWRDEARACAAQVARLVAMRTPETVAAMEAARGLV